MKRSTGASIVLIVGGLLVPGAACSSAAPPAALPSTTSSTRGTVPPDLTAGAPAGAIKVTTSSGPIWVDGKDAYAEGCKAKGLDDASATELLKAANTSPPAPNKTFNLICKS